MPYLLGVWGSIRLSTLEILTKVIDCLNRVAPFRSIQAGKGKCSLVTAFCRNSHHRVGSLGGGFPDPVSNRDSAGGGNETVGRPRAGGAGGGSEGHGTLRCVPAELAAGGEAAGTCGPERPDRGQERYRFRDAAAQFRAGCRQAVRTEKVVQDYFLVDASQCFSVKLNPNSFSNLVIFPRSRGSMNAMEMPFFPALAVLPLRCV